MKLKGGISSAVVLLNNENTDLFLVFRKKQDFNSVFQSQGINLTA